MNTYDLGEKKKKVLMFLFFFFLDNLIVIIGEAVWGFVLNHELFYYTLKSIGDKKVSFKSFMDFLNKKIEKKWSFMEFYGLFLEWL